MMSDFNDEQPTQRIELETLRECAAWHRAQLEQKGLVEKNGPVQCTPGKAEQS